MQKLSFLVILFLSVHVFAAEPIRHKMLLLDESRDQILYVDQFEPEKSWTLAVPNDSAWDTQFIGNGKFLVALAKTGGFREYDWATRKVVREVVNKKYLPTRSAIRFVDGRTLIAVDGKNAQFYLFDTEGKEIKAFDKTDLRGVRLVRRTPRNTVLFGTQNQIIEMNLDGEILREMTIPDAKYVYQIKELPNGNLWAANGYGCTLFELDKEGKTLKTLGGKPAPEGLWYFFYSKFQFLKNGNIVVATWTGHGAADSDKGQQVIEFDKDGKVVWSWHDPKLAGSINGVTILDDLDTNSFSEE
jgi:hypothetical protein